MESRHISIVSPGGQAHAYPSLGLCSELRKRGWRVTFVIEDRLAELVRQGGCEPVIYTPLGLQVDRKWDDLAKMPPSHPGWFELYASVSWPWLAKNAAVTVEQVSKFYDANPPDVVLYDRSAFAGRIVAHRSNCTAIQTFPSFAPDDGFLYWRDGVCFNPPPLLEFSNTLDSFFHSVGIRKNGNLWHTEDLNICFIPRELQFHGELFDDRYSFVGPCLDRPFRRIWSNNAAGKPIILISGQSGSTDVEFFRSFIQALTGTNYHVILSVGDQIADASLAPLPNNFDVNHFASHLEILPHASLLICRGGTGITLEAIYYGVRTILLPVNPDQEAWVYRMEQLGLGIRIQTDAATAEVIRDTIDRTLGDSLMQTRVDRMKTVVRQCGGAATAVDKIEEFLRVRQDRN